jgi:Flp pilus assembly protein TadG
MKLRLGWANTDKNVPESRARRKARALLRRFGLEKDGTAATEFALVALPFFTLLFGIFETTMVFFVSSTLENGMNEASRLIRTGNAQVGNMTANEFRQRICTEITALMDCGERLVIDVRAFTGFDDVEFTEVLDPGGELTLIPQFDPGGPGDVVLVRTFYVWDVMTPMFSANLSNMNGGARLISSSSVFRNEPFGSILTAD